MPFKKGQSGNPSGRKPISDAERRVEREAQHLTPQALKALERNLDCGTPAAEVAAAKEILDRAWGKPKQTVDKTVTKYIVDDTRIARAREALRQASETRSVQ